ncbi:MAG: efflux RND transporter permease subunit [Bacteroidales bacterium]|nr:efflux RND transporter permease subunit [Bacteroidales bacterium]
MKQLVRRKILVSMLFLALVVLGIFSYRSLPVELFPSAELPVLYLQVGYRSQMNPEFVEKDAVIPLEGMISEQAGVDELESNISRRRATIIVTYRQDVDVNYAYHKLEQKVSEFQREHRENYFVTLVKVNTDMSANRFMTLQARGEGDIDRIRNVVDQDIINELIAVDGVGDATVHGGRERSVEVIFNEEACEALNISPERINRRINRYSNQRLYGGVVYDAGKRWIVSISGEYSDIGQLGNTILDDQGKVLLRDVASISMGEREQETISRVNGMEAVTITIYNDANVNDIALYHKLQDVVEHINAQMDSKGVELVIQSSDAETMEENMNQILRLALIGGLMAIFILWVFLRNLRLVTVVAFAIPISILTSLNLFYAAGITINTLTLMGMALAIGMLLDNSVVVLENIYRLRTQGIGPAEAAAGGTRQVLRAVSAATLTTIAVFLPFAFSSEFFIKLLGNNVGFSIISTLGVSLVVALVFIPAVVFQFLRSQRKNLSLHAINFRNRVIRVYLIILRFCMRHPAQVLFTMVILFFATVVISLSISVNTLQEAGTDTFRVDVTMPGGSTLQTSDAIISKMEEEVGNVEEVHEVISNIEAEEASLTIELKEDFEKINDREAAQIKEDILDRLEVYHDVHVRITDMSSGGDGMMSSGGGGAGAFMSFMGVGQQTEEVIIKGSNYSDMVLVGENVEYVLTEESDDVTWARLSVSREQPEVKVLFDQRHMDALNIDYTSVQEGMSSFSRELESQTTFKQEDEEYAITIRSDQTEKKQEEQRGMDDLRNLLVESSGDSISASHHLEDFSSLRFSEDIASVQRLNREKSISVSYRFSSDVNDDKDLLESARANVDELIAGLYVPPGVAVEVQHEQDQYGEFKFLILAAFILIYMILASVFESFATPFVLLFSIPLAAIGSLIALIFTGNSLLSANTLTGFIILLGVVVNNGIILIDFVQNMRYHGMRTARAVISAGLLRVRPILITVITTVIGMLPLALGQGEYVGSIGAPFAITVIGGLLFSTLFTLVIIPTAYMGMQSTLRWFAGLPLSLKVLNRVALAGGVFLAISGADTLLWQMVGVAGVFIVVPSSTWFFTESLRKASADVIDKDRPIVIRIRNLVKIYERPSRPLREWLGNKNLERILGTGNGKTKTRQEMIWQLPLLFFLGWFAWFYQSGGFWTFTLSVILWIYVLFLLNYHTPSITSPRLRRWLNHIHRVVLRFFPLVILAIYQVKFMNPGATVFWGLLVYLVLGIHLTSRYLKNNQVNTARMKGRFKGLKKLWIFFVRAIPVIGRERKPFKALKSVSMDIQPGMFGLLGPNGAGKTTLMRVICGVLEQSYGKITINGVDTQEKREELQGLIGYLPQEFGMYENMTARDYLDYQALLKGVSDPAIRKHRVERVLQSVHMTVNAEKKIGSFSGGMKQRIGIAQVLLNLPRILVVDEPTAGLDPRERIRFRNLLVELSQDRVVIFSTHIIEDIASSCNLLAVLDNGEMKYYGKPSDMAGLARNRVWQFDVPAGEFERLSGRLKIVHHMRKGEDIRVRVVNPEKPVEQAKNVTPVLEDAYLWLLNFSGNEKQPTDQSKQ